ncbi:GNAT family N-acetyltransferase [Mucilaginibacter sp.]|jgi:RimJ/RimL family protein N-acetyltransferase|uniref:GNAT family N-acetyltransferase n=1 Tax=Mucilaginibacter sp. TaxID=1882438 RepID=UPI00356A386D
MNVVQHRFEPVIFEDKNWLIHPFRAGDFERFNALADQVFQILSDEKTLRFIPEKRLTSLEDAHTWLQKSILNFHTGRSYLHFISDKNTGKLAGMIDILSPGFIKQYYTLNDYPYFLEFYLISSAQGRLLMSNLLPEVVLSLRNQGILNVAAVTNRKNSASKRVLEKAGFQYYLKFDVLQDLFKVNYSIDNK